MGGFLASGSLLFKKGLINMNKAGGYGINKTGQMFRYIGGRNKEETKMSEHSKV